MKRTKLTRLQQYVTGELLPNLPVGFNNLEYVEPGDLDLSRKLVSVDSLKTRYHVSLPFHKPISKCLKNVDK